MASSIANHAAQAKSMLPDNDMMTAQLLQPRVPDEARDSIAGSSKMPPPPHIVRSSNSAGEQPNSTCSTCMAYQLNMCMAFAQAETARANAAHTTSGYTAPARRTVFGPKEWSDYVYVICRGWASHAVALADGRKQILSFLLPGDMPSAANIFEPFSGRILEAITNVTYRRFKRKEMRESLLGSSDLFDKFSKTWIEERMQADQLAVDLGRRRASERIARQILNLMDRLTKRGMARGHSMEFPIRQRHLADATGLTPVHVSKLLSSLQRANLIEIRGRSLTILDKEELQRVADCR